MLLIIQGSLYSSWAYCEILWYLLHCTKLTPTHHTVTFTSGTSEQQARVLPLLANAMLEYPSWAEPNREVAAYINKANSLMGKYLRPTSAYVLKCMIYCSQPLNQEVRLYHLLHVPVSSMSRNQGAKAIGGSGVKKWYFVIFKDLNEPESLLFT